MNLVKKIKNIFKDFFFIKFFMNHRAIVQFWTNQTQKFLSTSLEYFSRSTLIDALNISIFIRVWSSISIISLFECSHFLYSRIQMTNDKCQLGKNTGIHKVWQIGPSYIYAWTYIYIVQPNSTECCHSISVRAKTHAIK